ncbi:MAG: RluA family pseudouridine synthase [Bacilli bacterium]|nr:RluA family pseudouridine synthase [Bacilli bacterium]
MENQRNKSIVRNYSKEKLEKEYIVLYPSELLKFLLINIKHQSRNNIKSLLSNKKILVDGNVVTQFNYELHPKQIVRISKTPIVQKSLRKSLDIIYEDDDIVAINKPAGLLSIATDKEVHETAYRMVSDYISQVNKKNRIFITHRLDRDTSGVLLFAKNIKFRDLLQEDWNDNVTKRQYIAIVEGTLKKQEDTIKTWLRETKTHIMFSSSKKGDGKEATTHFKVIKSSSKYSLLEVNIDSGRKNQIRVHLADYGCPVVGDEKYGNSSSPINRLGLHAEIIEFVHPMTKKKISIKAKVPKEFFKIFKGK